MMKLDQIKQMMENVQDALDETQRSCYKINYITNNTRNSASTSQEDHAHSIKLKNLTTQADHSDAARAKAYTAAQGVQNHCVPNQFQNMNSCQYQKNDYSTYSEIEKRNGSNASGSEINLCPYLGQDDLKTKSGYSTEEDGIISMNTTASTSSKAAWYPYNRFDNTKRPASDSDNNSMVVELSDDEMDVPSKSSEKDDNISDKSNVKDRTDSSWNRLCSSQPHFNRRTPKCARLSNFAPNFNEITPSPSSPDRSLTQTRRSRKKKAQQQQDYQAGDEPSCSNNYQNHHSLNSNCTSSTFIRNHPQGNFIKAPQITNNFNDTVTSGCHDRHPHSALPCQVAADSNLHDFAAYKYIQPTQLSMYNNIPVLPDARPSMWPVGQIYIPTNTHVFLAFGQPHQPQLHHPKAHLHQYPKPPQLVATSTPQMANIPTSMSASIGRGNVIGQSLATSSIPTSSKQSASPMIRPELNWFRKELLCPPTQTGPDGQPIKVKAKRRPLPEWMAAAVENCNATVVELNRAHTASREQLYRMIVEEELEFQRSKQ